MAIILRGILLGLSGCLPCLNFIFPSLEAKDLGTYGHVFSIEEEDLLQSLKNKMAHLSKEEREAVQTQLQTHYASHLNSPHPVQGLKDAKIYRVFYVDPTLCTDQEIRDHQGHLIIPRGKCINPLETIIHLDALLFFDASNAQHLEWAKEQNQLVKWVLTKGKPLELEEKENRPVYFDQFGVLVQKFGIQHLPAKVSREGLQLKIEEFPLRG